MVFQAISKGERKVQKLGTCNRCTRSRVDKSLEGTREATNVVRTIIAARSEEARKYRSAQNRKVGQGRGVDVRGHGGEGQDGTSRVVQL